MPNLTGRWPFQYPAGGASVVPIQDLFEDLASSVADALNAYQLPLSVADSTERDAIFSSPVTGDRVYRLDTGLEQVYRSSAWKTLATRFVGVAVKKNVTQSVASGPTALTWNSSGADFDTDSFYSTGSNTRLTVPFAGIYDVRFQVATNSASSSFDDVTIRKNGSTDVFISIQDEGSSGAGVGVVGGNLLSLAASDYLEVRPSVNSPAGTWYTNGKCLFSARYLGSA